jgi:hypothetical protein
MPARKKSRGHDLAPSVAPVMVVELAAALMNDYGVAYSTIALT